MTFSLSKQAIKYLKSLQPRLTKHIISAIEELPDLGDVKSLTGKKTPPLYRLRIGKYCVIFLMSGDEIRILKIDSREHVYKK